MQSANVVLLQNDPQTSQSLVKFLCGSFHSIYPVRSLAELRTNIAKHRAQVVILDMELASIEDVERLTQEFPGTCIICTHRLADEEMWTAALNAGAADIVSAGDCRGILSAAQRTAAMSHSFAA
jgi:DNA-binding NarL/FixJ family response regulator